MSKSIRQTRVLRALLSAAVAGVSIALAPVASAQAAPFHLTLAPAFALVAPDQRALTFIVVNSTADPVTLSVTPSDAWVVPTEQSFTIAGNARHEVEAATVIPTNADAGDHETDVQFTLAPQGGTSPGMIRISWAMASRVIIATGGAVVRGLHVFGLNAPRIADSWDVPTVALTLDNSRGNVHELVNVAPFGQALVLRGQTKVLSVPWSDHPFIGVGSVTAGNETTSTLFIPWRVGGILLALLCGWVLWRRTRNDKRRNAMIADYLAEPEDEA
ncbi:MAG: hypothetical protein WCC30_06480 [Candidatus Dormiibacterota bacterium]